MQLSLLLAAVFRPQPVVMEWGGECGACNAVSVETLRHVGSRGRLRRRILSQARKASIALALAALAIGILALLPTSVSAASFERLADGRIALAALGEKFAFPEDELDDVELAGLDYPCERKPPRLSLALWRRDQRLAECLNKIIPDGFPPGSRLHFALRVRVRFEDGTSYPESGRKITDPIGTTSLLYPGGVRPIDLPSPPRLIDFVYVGVLHINKKFDPHIPADGPPDDLGYQLHGAGKAGQFYRLSADRRLGKATKPIDIACGSYCSVGLTSSDGYVGLRLEWMGPSPRSGWSKYDAAARKMADSIFAARPPGDLQ